jgi:hypothetical protein
MMRWFLALLLLTGAAFAQSQQPATSSNPPSKQSTEPATTDQRGTDKVPLAVKIIPTADTAQKAEQEERERREKTETDRKLAIETQRIADYTFWLGAFTLSLFAAAVGQIALFWVQLRLIRESLTDAKIAADAAKEGAHAARDSTDTAKLSMVASQRAYVHHNGMRWISHRDITDGSTFWRLRPQWINSGNTPTRALHVYVKYELRDTLLPDSFGFVPTEPINAPAMLAPHSIIESGHYNIEAEDLIAIREGKKFLYVWGLAKYRDVFPGTVEHITKFCVYASNITGDPLLQWNNDTNPMEILFPHYQQYNCADEDCNDQT